MVYITKDNRILFDISTLKHILKVSKVKIQGELKKQNAEIIKHKTSIFKLNQHFLI